MAGWVEWIGYIASVVVAISITIKGGLYFRILNMSGSVCFLVYGLLIRAWPIVFINIYAAGINIYYIIRHIKERKTKEDKEA